VADYRAKKRLGQNFLTNCKILERIAREINLQSDETAIEVGPGQGALTAFLAATGGRVIAVEFDRDLIKRLLDAFKSASNVEIVQADFLTLNPDEFGVEKFTLCGNLPFNISSPAIDWTMRYHGRVTRAVFMLQRELALRLTSEPGGKNWSPLAIFTQLAYEARRCFDVGPENFKPPPKVTSSVVSLIPKPKFSIPNYPLFEKVVRTSFAQRRKTLLNNLTNGLSCDNSLIVEILNQLGYTRSCRAEEISTAGFLELTAVLASHNIR